MDEISVKVWGVACDGSGAVLIKANDAQAVLSVMNMQFLALSNERDLLLSKLRTTNEYCLTNCVDGGETKDKVIELACELGKVKTERNALAAQLIPVKQSGGTGVSPCANFCESVALKKDLDLLREHADKVKAERNGLSSQLLSLHRILSDARDCVRLCHKQGLADYKLLQTIDHALQKNSYLKFLADIKAEAGRAGFIEGYEQCHHDIDNDYTSRSEPMANEYADKIRKGGE
jgi:hypothetical protein